MSLRSRLTGAVAGNASRKRNRVDADAMLATTASSTATEDVSLSVIPYSMLQGFLESHPLIAESGTDPKIIHSVIVSMHTHIFSSLQSDSVAPVGVQNDLPVSKPRDEDRCRHCDPGICILDEREGVIYCNNCGIVETLRSVNVQPEYNAAPEVGRHQRGRARILSGVSDWVMAKNRPVAESHTVHYREFMEDLEHWNYLLGHSVDVLRGMGRALSDWSDPGHSRLSRAVAALLWPLICNQLPRGQEIRRRLRCGFSLPEIHDREEESIPHFACSACGAKETSRRAAKFHCKGVRSKVSLKR